MKKNDELVIKKNEEYEIGITGLTSEGAGVGRIYFGEAGSAGHGEAVRAEQDEAGRVGHGEAGSTGQVEAGRAGHGEAGNEGQDKNISAKNGFAVFVEGALPGEKVRVLIVKALKNYAFGKLIEILKPSPDRVHPKCPVAARCGGCKLQHMSYDAQLEAKRKHVEDVFKKIGGFKDEIENKSLNIEPTIRMEKPWNYRNKSQMPFGRDINDGIIYGFYKSGSHDIVDIKTCLIQDELADIAAKTIKDFAKKHSLTIYDEKTGEGLLRHVMTRVGKHTGEVMVVLVINGNKLTNERTMLKLIKKNAEISKKNAKREKVDAKLLENRSGNKNGNENENENGNKNENRNENRNEAPSDNKNSEDMKFSQNTELEKNLVDRLLEAMSGVKKGFKLKSVVINTNTKQTNVVLGNACRTIFGNDYILDKIGGFKFKISPLSFFQVNTEQTNILYGKALEFADLKGGETVIDAYCGAGTISLFLSKMAKKVIGVEIVEPAVKDAIENAKLNSIENVMFYKGEAEVIIPDLYKKGTKADVIVVDPPRKGCDVKLLDTIAEMKPEKVVYVSCDPATCARDVKYLVERGYELNKVQPVDMFPWTGHVEAIILMTKCGSGTKK